MGCRISSENHHKGGSRRVGSSATRSCITDFFWTNMFKVIGSDGILFLGLAALNSSQQIDQLLSILLPSRLSPRYLTLVHSSSHDQLHRWQLVRDVHRYSRCASSPWREETLSYRHVHVRARTPSSRHYSRRDVA